MWQGAVIWTRNPLLEYPNIPYIIKRSDFQAKIIKEIHNNYYEL